MTSRNSSSGSAIKETRESLGFTLREITTEVKKITGVNISKSHLSEVESGLSNLSPTKEGALFVTFEILEEEMY
jgi:transcriptional regulator with XRE-family HTH domain